MYKVAFFLMIWLKIYWIRLKCFELDETDGYRDDDLLIFDWLLFMVHMLIG